MRIAGIVFILAAIAWLYNIGTKGDVIDFPTILPPFFLAIAGGFLIKASSKK